jgi:hypothetical protein
LVLNSAYLSKAIVSGGAFVSRCIILWADISWGAFNALIHRGQARDFTVSAWRARVRNSCDAIAVDPTVNF